MRLAVENLHIVGGANDGPSNIVIDKGRITKVGKNRALPNANTLQVNLEDALIFPSLVNSHDHLEFNLFPEIGQPNTYRDYLEWAKNIHGNHQGEIQEVLKIPLEKRIKYGIYKNLCNGITQVANHGHYYPQYKNEVVEVINACINLHSVSFEKYWKLKLNLRKPHLPAVIHIGEGTSRQAHKEIDTFIRWNLRGRKTIGVHGVAMDTKQARHFAALVWCPDSNLRMYNQTADVEQLKETLPILFGTDSTLSAHWNFWEQLRVARAQSQLTDQELFDSLTTTAVNVWNLQSCKKIHEGERADVVIAKKKKNHIWDAFYAIDPEDILLIIKEGNLVYFDETLLTQMDKDITEGFDRIKFNNHVKFVRFDTAIRPDEVEINF